MLHIISFLPLREALLYRRISTASNVYILYHLETLKWLDLSEYRKITDQDLLVLLQRCSNTAFLDISECNLITFDTLRTVSSFSNKIRIHTPFHFFLKQKDKFIEEIEKKNFGIFQSLHNISVSDMDLRGIPLLEHSHHLHCMEIRLSKLDVSTSFNVSL